MNESVWTPASRLLDVYPIFVFCNHRALVQTFWYGTECHAFSFLDFFIFFLTKICCVYRESVSSAPHLSPWRRRWRTTAPSVVMARPQWGRRRGRWEGWRTAALPTTWAGRIWLRECPPLPLVTTPLSSGGWGGGGGVRGWGGELILCSFAHFVFFCSHVLLLILCSFGWSCHCVRAWVELLTWNCWQYWWPSCSCEGFGEMLLESVFARLT